MEIFKGVEKFLWCFFHWQYARLSKQNLDSVSEKQYYGLQWNWDGVLGWVEEKRVKTQKHLDLDIKKQAPAD